MSDKKSSSKSSSSVWLYGKHACFAALVNPNRTCHELLLLPQAYDKYAREIPKHIHVMTVDKQTFDKKLSPDAVHQGIALRVDPLPELSLHDPLPAGPLVILDQVTDPHNIGAILRSCAAFHAAGLIVTKNHCPQESGVMAKSACGALEIVPLIRVTNLDAAIRELQTNGYWCYGLDGSAKDTIASAKFDPKTVFVFGSEGAGLRDLTMKRCDYLVRLPINTQVESLNVSNAVAVTLYEYARRLPQ